MIELQIIVSQSGLSRPSELPIVKKQAALHLLVKHFRGMNTYLIPYLETTITFICTLSL